jgi:protein-tyrosine phosphatase
VNERAGPTPDSYWVVPGRFLAGNYPLARLTSIRDAGIDFFVDLTQEDEYGLSSYASGLEYRRRAIRDFGCPTPDGMVTTLDLIDDALAQGKNVYVHCYAGVGRTGTVVGCWLVRHGMAPSEALAQIARWREGLRNERRRSPESDEQMQFLHGWSERAPAR